MTNLIITSLFVVGFYSSTLFLVFQVLIKGCKGNFSFKLQKLIFQREKNRNDHFSHFFLLFLLFHVYRPIILTIDKFFLEFHWLFKKFKEIITNFIFWKFRFENFCPIKNKCQQKYMGIVVQNRLWGYIQNLKIVGLLLNMPLATPQDPNALQ